MAEGKGYPILLQVGEELEGLIGALLIPLRLPVMLAFSGYSSCWLVVSLRRLLD